MGLDDITVDERADALIELLFGMRKWGYAIIEDADSWRQSEAERIKRATIVAEKLLAVPSGDGGEPANRLAVALVNEVSAARRRGGFACLPFEEESMAQKFTDKDVPSRAWRGWILYCFIIPTLAWIVTHLIGR